MRGYHSSCPATLPLVSPLLKPSGWTAVSFAHRVLWLIVSNFLTLPLLSFTFTLCFTSTSNLPLTSSYFLSLSVCVLCTAVSVTALVLSWCMYANLHYRIKKLREQKQAWHWSISTDLESRNRQTHTLHCFDHTSWLFVIISTVINEMCQWEVLIIRIF